MTQDGKVPFTSKEEITRDAEEAQELVDRPMRTWLQTMAKTDSIPRWAEDLISGDTPAKSTMDAIAAKKALRATKP